MLADPKSITLSTNFAFQWLGLDRLAEIRSPIPNIFPYAGDPRPDYLTEMKLFVDSIFHEDHDVMDLLTANYTFVNERPGAGLRDQRCAWRPIPPCDARGFQPMGGVGEGRGTDGHGLSEPHGTRVAWSMDSGAGHRHAAVTTPTRPCLR